MINFWYVLLGASLIAATAGIVGVWLVLRREALRGDVVSHSVLAGICTAFLVHQEKNWWLLLLGASLSAWLSLWTMDFLQTHTKLKKDAIMALVLSFFFAIGLWILVKIQFLSSSAKSGLDSFLFGKTASLLPQDIFVALIVFILVATINLFAKRRLFWATFDAEYSESIGYSTKFARDVVTFMSIVSIVIGLQAVGVVLMSALLITPATIALVLSPKNLSNTFLWSICVNILVVLAGTLISYFFPKSPTGPWIVVFCSFLAFGVFGMKKIRQ